MMIFVDRSDRVREGKSWILPLQFSESSDTAAEIPSGGGDDNVQIEGNAEAEVVYAALLALPEIDENVDGNDRQAKQ